jgi:hypothetical protein
VPDDISDALMALDSGLRRNDEGKKYENVSIAPAI